MDIYLLISLAGAICVTLGGIGLHYETKKRIEELEEEAQAAKDELSRHKRQIYVLEQRETKKSDCIYIDWGEQTGGVQ